MTQKRIEEKIDAIEQDLTDLKTAMQGVPAIEASLLALTQWVEKLSAIVDKQQRWVEETNRSEEDNPTFMASSIRKGKTVNTSGTNDHLGETSTTRSKP